MIIRRKPISNDALRKPRTIGLSVLRQSIQRLQTMTVRRTPQAQSDEPINWGMNMADDSAAAEANYQAAPVVEAEVIADEAVADFTVDSADTYDAFGASGASNAQPSRTDAVRRTERTPSQPSAGPTPRRVQQPSPAQSQPAQPQVQRKLAANAQSAAQPPARVQPGTANTPNTQRALTKPQSPATAPAHSAARRYQRAASARSFFTPVPAK